MRVLLLSPYPERLAVALAHDQVEATNDNVTLINPEAGDYDCIVCYGYRIRIREPILSRFKGRIINLHIGYLPWNRGADPNFWSWLDGTYKGVTIHHIDSGLDTGPIIARQILSPPNTMTLRQCYEFLQQQVEGLFAFHWPRIKADAGTFHTTADKEPWFAQLPAGWDTPCHVVEEMGRRSRES